MKLVHATWEPAGSGPFPTIFAMHGWGSNAMDLQGLAPYVADGRFLVICPQGSFEVEIGAINGYGWYQMRPGSQPDPEKVDAAVDELRGFLDEASARYPVDPKKIVVAGFSQGGMMAYNLAMRWPERFAALVGIATAFPGTAVGARHESRSGAAAAHDGAAWTRGSGDRHDAGAQIGGGVARAESAGGIQGIRLRT